MSAPLVSVILPVRDAGPLLRVAVESILAQTCSDLELIVVDDGSSDGAVEQLALDDPRLQVFHNPGRGLVTALNFAAFQACGRYLARMDADDVALPERLERQVELLEREPGVGIAGAQVEIFADGGVGQGYRVYQAWINGLCTPEAIGREMFIESPIPHPTAMFSKELFRELGGYRDVAWPEDYDLWLRAHLNGVRMAKPDGILLRWRDHARRLSRADERYALHAFTAAKAHYLARSRLQDRPAVIWGAAPTGALLHDALRREGVTVSAFIDIDRKKIGGRKRGLPVLPPEAAADVAPALIVGAVGARGARDDIRGALDALHLEEGWDYLFAA
jgi:glycosyltransferase involved in cell wall biosynthesis